MTPRSGTIIAALVLIGVTACAPQPLVQLVARHDHSHSVVLEVRSGSKVNARVAPALEFADGSVIRLTEGRVDADGDYFVEPPQAIVQAPPGTPVTVRASVCVDAERLCRTVEAQTTLP